MDNNTYEQEIDLKDLMFAILHKWRPIIICAIILGIALGGYKVGNGLAKQRDAEFVQKEQENYNNDILTYERTKSNYEREIKNLTTNLEYQEDYYNNSILMQISPYDKCVAQADIFVKTGLPEIVDGKYILLMDNADSILKAYASYIKQGGGVSTEVSKGNINYLQELIHTDIDYDSDMISLTVSYTDEDGAEKILDEILSNIQDQQISIQNKMGDHQVIVLNKDVKSVTDLALATLQKNSSDLLTTLQKTLDDKQNALEELKEPNKPAALSNVTLLKSGVKYGILGGVLGGFIAVFYSCVSFLMSDKLYSSKELKNRFGIKTLGVFSPEGKKRAFMKIDKWLDRLEHKADMSEADTYEVIAINVENYKDDCSKILVTGTVELEILQDVATELSSKCETLKLTAAADMNKSPSTLKMLSEYEGIILVEKRGRSIIGEIQKELDVIENLQKKVVGCIIY